MSTAPQSSRFDPEIVRQLGRLDLIAAAIVDGVRHGLHRARRQGFSTEFSDFKPYTPGDDPRRLDWRVFARTDRLFVRRYEAETSLEVTLLLDASASMGWSWDGELSKLDYAVQLLAALACLHMRQQDPVGLLAGDAHSLRHLPPRCRRTHLDDMLAALERLSPGGGETFPVLVRDFADVRRHRGLVIACSDLEDEPETVERALARLAGTGHEIVMFHVLHHAELDVPFTDATHLRDSESGAVMPVNVRVYRERYRAGVRRFQAHWRDCCEGHGMLYRAAHTRMSCVDVICTMLNERELRRLTRRRGTPQ